ncbi:cohesin domain-containing protein, partial [Candidatus Poribacteria bacterium]
STKVKPGDEVVVSYSNAPGHDIDWIGMFRADAPDTEYITFQFLGGNKSGTVTFTMPQEPGLYNFRMLPNNLYEPLLAVSAMVEVADEIVTLSASPSIVKPGDEIVVSYSGAPGGSSDWIGIFRVGASDGEYISWQYTGGTENGALTFIAPSESGNYNFRLFPGGSDNSLPNASNAVTVTEETDVEPALLASPGNVKPGGSIVVSYSNAPGNAWDWIGMFREGTSDREYIGYHFLNGSRNGTVIFAAPTETGTYNFRMFPNNLYQPLLATSNVVNVSDETDIGAVLLASPGSVEPGENINVSYSGAPGNALDWVGIYRVGTSDGDYLSYQYLEGNKSGTLVFVAPAEAGKYSFRMFSDRDELLAVSNNVNVEKTDTARIWCTQTSVVKPGENMVVYYSGAPGNASDWIGMYSVESSDGNYISWQYLSGNKSGELTFTAPTGTGNYNFRMFVNNGYDRIATGCIYRVSDGMGTEPIAQLIIPEVIAAPGETISVPIIATDATGIASADIVITYDSTILTIKEAKTIVLSSGMTLVSNIDNAGKITLAMANIEGISGGSGALIDMVFTVNASAQVGDESPVRFEDVELYSGNLQEMSIGTQDGKVKIGLACVKGDVNGDGRIRSNDAILALRISSGILTPTPQQECAADMNDDGRIRSNDAILILRKSTGLAAPSREYLAAGGRNITVELKDVYVEADKSIVVLLKVDNGDILAGGDICIAYDSLALRAVDISSETNIMLSANLTEPGIVKIAFAGTDKLDNGTLASVRFQVLVDHVSPMEIRVAELYGSDSLPLNVRSIDAKSGSYSARPKHNALLQNYPNPFNPETWMPYHLSSANPVMVKIYSTSGQLIRTLDLGHKDAGVYASRSKAAYWDGTNEAGEEVTSGVYFYSITAGDFSAMRKLVVQK